MKTTLASIGTGALGIAILLALALISVLLVQGGVWLSALLFPWLAAINALALLVTLFVLLPNAVFSSTPKFAGSGMMIVSYVFGATLWVWSLLLTYTLWGGFWLFIGLFMAGVGVVPLAMTRCVDCADVRCAGMGLQPCRKSAAKRPGSLIE